MDLWYPKAVAKPLGAQTEPSIGVPRVLIVHTIVGNLAGTDAMFRRQGYDGVESTFGIGGPWEPGDLDGVIWQWQALDRQADAQGAGNAYATSVETADGGKPDRPWTPKQVDALTDLIVWWCRQTGHPAQMVTGTGGSGIGYHSQFTAWNPNNHSCPNPTRIQQLRTIVVPAAARLLTVTSRLSTAKPTRTALHVPVCCTATRQATSWVYAFEARYKLARRLFHATAPNASSACARTHWAARARHRLFLSSPFCRRSQTPSAGRRGRRTDQ